MKNRLLSLCILLFSICGTVSAAATAPQNYLMWQMPGSGISLPVYVYSGGQQVSFIPSDSLQVFAGKYSPGVTTESFTLYYQTGTNWFSCVLSLTNGAVDSNTTCPGAVINPPVSQNGATSNVYTVAFGTTAWPAASAAPTTYTPTSYSNRTLTFKNNTQYPMIQIGESCNPSNATNSAPSCQNAAIIATITKGTPYVVSVGVNGLNSAAFYLSSYCTASSAKACGTAPTIAQCSNTPAPPPNWVCTGGYFPGQTPYATKIEPTILAVTNSIPNGASNVDVSAVDGYSVGVKFYPASPAYCTYTVPPENSNVLGAGLYSAAQPFAQVAPKSATALQTMCKASSQLPANYSGGATAWNLAVTSPDGKFAGCMSPCTYATANSPADAPQFCCTGNYNTPGTCDVAAGSVGANTSTYNTNIQSSTQFQNVYGFAYGDAGSDYACPPETNFVVEFITTAAKSKKTKK